MKKVAIKGGEFMVRDVAAEDVFIPEEFDEEQQMMAETCQDFLDTEVIPNLDRIDSQEEGYMRDRMEKAGELGLLGIAVPEELDGFGQSFVTNQLMSEKMGAGYSFSVAYSCHTGIGTMPILYYGNEEQKAKYIPKLATGEWMGAYALTEPGAGSDANSGSTKAVLNEDGTKYILNGQKMWITNAGFADVFTVFAKVDNDRVLSAFIVERDFPGLSFNPEEKKMGIKGSSTRQVFFNDCEVPVENMLGGRGKGFRIALQILHMGRIKLGGNVIGAAKNAIGQSVNYSNERKQFGSLISNFGAIKYKLAEQVIRTFANESTVYRASADVDEFVKLNTNPDMSKDDALVEAYGQFAVEAAVLKVYGSEALDYVVDESVQILGGMGYSSEMGVERGYRDSRINRIFEGTNEINRILVIDTLLKRGAKKEYDLFGEAERIVSEMDTYIAAASPEGTYYEKKAGYISNFKKLGLMLIDLVSGKFQRKLVHEQEILNNLSDIIMNTYVAESLKLRVEKLESKNTANIDIYKDILDVFIFDASESVRKAARDIVFSAEPGDADKYLKAADVFSASEGVNTRDARRRIADKLIEDNKYNF